MNRGNQLVEPDKKLSNMDGKKDNKKRETEIQEYFNSQSVTVNPFAGNFAASHLYGRAERLLAGVYILTRNISDTEPIKGHIRGSAHELVSAVGSWFRTRGESKGVFVKDMLLRAREIGSLARVLAIAGHVSQANLQILLQALSDFGAYAARHQHDLTQVEIGIASMGVQLDDFVPVTNEARSAPARPRAAVHSDAASPDNQSQARPVMGGSEREHERAGETRSDSSRTQIILDLLSQGGKLGIRDIANQIVGVSEKTVQRELAALVARGILKKEGEKRWSTYSLVK